MMMSKMSEHIEQINEMIREFRGSPSSSDSESEKPSSHNSRKKHLFGRKEPIHALLGGGKSADIILWRNKQLSGSILAGVTVIWLLFEWIGYHLLTFICHSLILTLVVCFLWSSTASFVNRSPPKFPEIIIPEDAFLWIAHVVRHEMNEAFATFRYVASGKDLKNFLKVIGGLWIASIVGNWFSFLTLIYIVFMLVYTAPVLYEKYEDHVDAAAQKAIRKINKHYAVLNRKVLQKLSGAPCSSKKQN
ncbi:reticulon-like protein B6 [Zingiber officinale]|uniref:reticulon-like protein B6 n=1 Tax=Zingiber officinale TaxID=94328 RepID=UPI001C4DB1D6|nr:reticulon-like protein B6 [Zingiber officinale]